MVPAYINAALPRPSPTKIYTANSQKIGEETQWLRYLTAYRDGCVDGIDKWVNENPTTSNDKHRCHKRRIVKHIHMKKPTYPTRNICRGAEQR